MITKLREVAQERVQELSVLIDRIENQLKINDSNYVQQKLRGNYTMIVSTKTINEEILLEIKRRELLKKAL